jgi:type IV pilus assembly protein PilW
MMHTLRSPCRVMPRRPDRRGLPGRPNGFTLVEVMVALAIGTLILAALAVLFSRNSGNQAELERVTRQHENARFALDLLTEDLMHAGYYGEFNPDTMTLPPTYQTPGPCPASVNDLGWATPAGIAPTLPVAVQGIAAATAIACGQTRQPNTMGLMVRHADTSGAIAPAAIVAGNLYVQSSRCTTDTDRLRVGAAAADFDLLLPDCAAVNARVLRVVQRTYYVASCNDCAAGDGIPTLRRIEWIDGQRRDTPLAEGIENLQLEFGVDTNVDGQPDQYLGVAGITGVAPLLWNNVVAVRVHLLARSTQVTPGYTDPRTYTLAAVAVTPADGFKRTLLTSTVRLLNIGGRRE